MNTLFTLHHKRITAFLIALLIIIPLGITAYSLIYQELHKENQAEIARNNQVANYAASYLNEYLYGYEVALQAFATTPSLVYEDREETKRMLKDFDLARTEPSLLWVANSKGELVAKYPEDYIDKNILELEFFKESMKGDSFVGGPYTGSVTGMEIIVISVPYYREGQVAGVVGVSIPLTELQKKLCVIQGYDTGYVALLNLKGDVLGHPNLEEFRKTFSFLQSPLYENLIIDKVESGYFDKAANDPERKMHSFVKLKEAPWVVVAVHPLEVFELKLHQTIARNLVALIFVGMLLGFLIHYLLLLRDVNNAEKMKQREKLAVVGELAAGVAHEIRNPLTSIKGFVQLIDSKKGTEIPPFYIETILDELDRIEQIVGEMVVLAKPAHEEKSQVDVPTLLHDTVNLMSPQAARQNIGICLEIEPGLPFVMGVRNQLKQVVINLLKNSIEALEEDKGEIMITATYKAKHIFITVADNGKGIEPEVISKLGTPFFSTKDSGTGLGLMISYRIIQNHEGEVKVESKPGVGAKFQIILPVK